MRVMPLALKLIEMYHNRFDVYPNKIEVGSEQEFYSLMQEKAEQCKDDSDKDSDIILVTDKNGSLSAVLIDHAITDTETWKAERTKTCEYIDGIKEYRSLEVHVDHLSDLVDAGERAGAFEYVNAVLHSMKERFKSSQGVDPKHLYLPSDPYAIYNTVFLRCEYRGIPVIEGEDFAAKGKVKNPHGSIETVTVQWDHLIPRETE